MIANFTETFHCLSHAHCDTCLTDAKWRAEIGAPDECPYGSTEAVEQPAISSKPTMVGRRGRMCIECRDNCPLKKLTTCQRMARLKRENFHCPEGRF